MLRGIGDMRAMAVLVGLAAMMGLAAPLWALSGEQIVRNALNLHEGIQDYRAQVTVTSDIEGVDIPERKITVYYKRPDKVRVDSEGVVFVPKSAVNPGALAEMITEGSRSVLSGQKQVNGRPLYFVKILPSEGATGARATGRVLMWVWGDNWTVDRLEMWGAEQQLYSVRWTHQQVAGKYWMPQWIVFSDAAGRMPGGKSGQVRLLFSQVQVNIGLKDEFFAQQ